MTDEREATLEQHREQARNRPRCCRKLAHYYDQLGRVHLNAANECAEVAGIYEAAGRVAGTWDDDDECEEMG